MAFRMPPPPLVPVRLALALAALTPLLEAQRALPSSSVFRNLAPSYDGNSVRFATLLRQKGSEGEAQHPHEKIFVWEAGGRGLRLLAQRPPRFSLGPGFEAFPAGDYRLLASVTSADGLTTAVTTLDDCNFGTPCRTSITRYRTVVSRPGQPDAVYDGAGSLSPNGRYLFTGPRTWIVFGTATRVDVETGARTVTEPAFGGHPPLRHYIGDNGAVVVRPSSSANPPALHTPPDRVEQLTALPPGASEFRVDRTGRLVFFNYLPGSPSSRFVGVYDTGRGRLTELGAFSSFDISDDGSRVLAASRGRLWMIRTDASAPPVPVFSFEANEAPDEIAVSGDGSAVYLSTSNARIVRVDLRTLAEQEIVPRTPLPDSTLSTPGRLAPGGYYTALSQRPITVEGVRFQGRPLWFLGPVPPGPTGPGTTFAFQVPFDEPASLGGTAEYLLPDPNPASPFVAAIASNPSQVLERAPVWLGVLHDDFRGPVTSTDPALPGEIVHVYATGLGRVKNPPEPGQPAPTAPLSPLIDPLVCQVSQQAPDYREQLAETLWAGLAPGWIGLYQADIRLPAAGFAPGFGLVCLAPLHLGAKPE